MILLLVFYVDLISVAASVAEITRNRFVFFPRDNLKLVPEKEFFNTLLENSWKTAGKLLETL